MASRCLFHSCKNHYCQKKSSFVLFTHDTGGVDGHAALITREKSKNFGQYPGSSILREHQVNVAAGIKPGPVSPISEKSRSAPRFGVDREPILRFSLGRSFFVCAHGSPIWRQWRTPYLLKRSNPSAHTFGFFLFTSRLSNERLRGTH